MIDEDKVVTVNLAVKLKSFAGKSAHIWVQDERGARVIRRRRPLPRHHVGPAPTEEELMKALPQQIERYMLRRYRKGDLHCVEYIDGHNQIYSHCRKEKMKLADALAELWLELEETGW